MTLDGIACALVGAQQPWSQRAVDIVGLAGRSRRLAARSPAMTPG